MADAMPGTIASVIEPQTFGRGQIHRSLSPSRQTAKLPQRQQT